MARGGRPRGAPPPPRRPSIDLDPVPFPGGVEAALEFAAFEKGLFEGGSGGTAQNRAPSREPPNRDPPMGWRTPISEPNRDSARWRLAGAGTATAIAAILLLLGSRLLPAGFAVVLQAMAQH